MVPSSGETVPVLRILSRFHFVPKSKTLCPAFLRLPNSFFFFFRLWILHTHPRRVSLSLSTFISVYPALVISCARNKRVRQYARPSRCLPIVENSPSSLAVEKKKKRVTVPIVLN
jgi:hypothetical protein